MLPLSYPEVVKAIEARGIMPDRPPSLSPMIEGLKRIVSPSALNPQKTIVVAGTNGKGSVCACLEALFLSAGKSVGVYTSPHLKETTERIRINGKDISPSLFCQSYLRVIQKTENVKLSHFEILTLMASWLFYSEAQVNPVEWKIFEVGLGGKWDATNAIPHQNCIITSISYDHQNLLGNTLESIAENKFGIIGPEALVVHSTLPDEVHSLAEQIRTSTRSRWVPSLPFKLHVTHKGREPQFFLETSFGSVLLSLPGTRAAQNAATALTAFGELGFNVQNHLHALQNIRWPGRMERFQHPRASCPIYLSGDHNPAGIQSLIDLLSYYPRNHLHLVVGIGKDKDQDGILAPLFALPQTSIYLTETPFKGRSIHEYNSVWRNQAQGSFSEPADAFQAALSSASSDDLIVVTGSLYLIGKIYSL